MSDLVATCNKEVEVTDADYASFQKDLESLINRHSMENGSDTPDFIIAEYLVKQLKSFNETTKARRKWYGDPTLLDRIIGDGPLPPVTSDVIRGQVANDPTTSNALDMVVQAERRKSRHEEQVESYLAEYSSKSSKDDAE